MSPLDVTGGGPPTTPGAPSPGTRSEPWTLTPGQPLGPYTVVRELGRGAMGAVYVARHTTLGHEVALKVVREVGGAGRARFQREARAAARLHHPSIVAVRDVGEAGSIAYLTMDLIHGSSLEDRLRAGPLPPDEVVRVGAALARALAHAHDEGVLHRDLKPANILIARDGSPAILDFGIAKDLRDVGSLTASGDVIGTPSYMAPEQADGRGKHADGRADVYALGATLYAALAGRPPFVAQGMVGLLKQILVDAPAPPSAHRPGVPPALDGVCLRCLEKDPERRYPNAAALADALEELAVAPPRRAGPGRCAALVLAAAVLTLAALALARMSDGAVRTPEEPAAQPAPIASPPEARQPEAAASTEPGGEEGWRPVQTRDPQPSARAASALVALPARRTLLLFGGDGGPGVGVLDDTWEWDGARWDRPAPARSPPGRAGHVMVTCEAGALLFGGIGARGLLDDTWEWDAASRRWSSQPAGGPGPRLHAAMAWDTRRQQAVLFGGAGPGDSRLDDTWVWTARAGWKKRMPARVPVGRDAASMAFDEARGVAVLFGGRAGRYRRDTWEWDGTAWNEVALAGPHPPERFVPAAMVYDPRRQAVVLFGGAGVRGLLSDTWSWNGDEWTELPPSGSPPPRNKHVVAFDLARPALVTFGGDTPRGDGFALMQDLWER